VGNSFCNHRIHFHTQGYRRLTHAKEAKEAKPSAAPAAEPDIYYIDVRGGEAAIIGYIKGETLIAEEATRTLKVGTRPSRV
jgi:hypothetical protein